MKQVDIYLYISSKAPIVREAEYRYKLVCRQAPDKPLSDEGKVMRTSGNCLALVCALKALGRMTKPSILTIHTDSTYLMNGQKYLEEWKKNGWKTTGGKPLKNAQLWQMLYKKQQGHRVSYQYENSCVETGQK